MRNAIFLILALLLLAALVIGSLYFVAPQVLFPQANPQPTVSQISTPAPTVQTTSTATSSAQPTTAQKIKIYLVALEDNGQRGPKIGCNDSLVPVERTVTPTNSLLEAAIAELLKPNEMSSLYNVLNQSSLAIDKITLQSNSADIYLKGNLVVNGACDTPRIQEQLKATATQFPTVQIANFYINNRPLNEALSTR